MPNWILPNWNLPDWMTMPEWLEPKLLVLFVLIGTVLFLSRDRSQESAPERSRGERVTPMLKHRQR